MGLFFKKKTPDFNTRFELFPDGNYVTHPRGCSGAGYWFFPDRYDLGKMFLAGVFIEYHKNDDVGFVTKVDEVIKFIETIEPNQ